MVTRALEQRHADFVLELPNLLAERRLRGAQPARRAGEAELFGHRDEVAKMPEFHVSVRLDSPRLRLQARRKK